MIEIGTELATALTDAPRERGTTAEELALATFAAPVAPRDDWERRLLGAAVDSGMSLSDEALSREAMCD